MHGGQILRSASETCRIIALARLSLFRFVYFGLTNVLDHLDPPFVVAPLVLLLLIVVLLPMALEINV